MIHVTVPKKIQASTANILARYLRLIAECGITQAVACDEAAQALHKDGNTHEAFKFETAAELYRADVREANRITCNLLQGSGK